MSINILHNVLENGNVMLSTTINRNQSLWDDVGEGVRGGELSVSIAPYWCHELNPFNGFNIISVLMIEKFSEVAYTYFGSSWWAKTLCKICLRVFSSFRYDLVGYKRYCIVEGKRQEQKLCLISSYCCYNWKHFMCRKRRRRP